MSQSSIVSDSRPSRAQVLAASATALVALAIALVALPYGRVLLDANSGFMPAFGGVTCFADLATAALLIGQARAADSRPAALLAGAYLFSFLIVIPHLLAFPGVFAAQSIIGKSVTATWLWCAWHGGFALFVANYALSVGRGEERARRLWPILAAVTASVAGMVLLTTLGLPYLPTILVGGSYMRMTEIGVGPAVLACNSWRWRWWSCGCAGATRWRCGWRWRCSPPHWTCRSACSGPGVSPPAGIWAAR